MDNIDASLGDNTEPYTLDSGPVVVRRHEKLFPRESIYDVMDPIKRKYDAINYNRAIKRRELFIQAFQVLKQKTHTDPRSFYQIAGIHGFPYTAYDHVDPSHDSSSFLGYCEHGSTLFPTWHRPYMLLFEQELIHCALKFIEDNLEDFKNYRDSSQTDGTDEVVEAREIAREIRLPYWDWADHMTQAIGVPPYFVEKKMITVTYPKEKPVTNPFYCFIAPENMYADNDRAVSGFNHTPISKPNYEPDEVLGMPITPAFHPTIRHPNRLYESDIGDLQATVIQQCNFTFRPGVCNMFAIDSWIEMASHYGGSEDPDHPKYGIYSSLEAVHDSVHDAVGGQAGHMSNVPIAAFDPIFFFHHCNVDRLFALWQVMHPDRWVTPCKVHDQTFAVPRGTLEDETTSLYPFRKAAMPETFWTSNDVRSIEDLGYTYPDIEHQKKQSQESFRKEITRKYLPVWWAMDQVFVTVWNIPKHKFPGSYKLLVFVDCTEDDVLSGRVTKRSQNYAGFFAVFSRGKSAIKYCGKCIENEALGKRIIFTHDISLPAHRLHLDIDTIPDFKSTDDAIPAAFDMAIVAEVAPRQLHGMTRIIKYRVFKRSPVFDHVEK